MNKKKEVFLLVFLILLLFAINYRFLDSKFTEFLEESDFGIVERIVDGDTLIVNGNSTRLLGINTPERGEKYYNEAKSFLSETTLNKTVELKKSNEDKDRYNRLLRYVFIDEKNIDLELVKQGFANLYFPSGKDIYYNNFRNAWEECLIKNINLCEKSSDECAKCVELKELNVKTQTITLYNNCTLDCNLDEWSIKDEGRKKFIFNDFILNSRSEVNIIVGNKTNRDDILFWNDEEYVWTSSGDTLFLRDEEGGLVVWRNY